MLIEWTSDTHVSIDGVAFVATVVALGERPERFVIVKSPELVRRYLDLIEAERPRAIVELGIKDGGSTALLALAATPDVLLAADLETACPKLTELVASRGLPVSVGFGLDQGDRAAVASFAAQYEGAFDLVVDDASHVLAPTRVSFEVLFPRLRPGGLFIIEDWAADCVTAAHLATVLPEADRDRLAAVNEVMRILNDPSRDLPEPVKASMTTVGASGNGSVFDQLAEAAGRADLSGLGPVAVDRPLADLVVELTMIQASCPGVIDELRVDAEWVTVRRGHRALDSGFRLGDCWTDFYGYLSPDDDGRRTDQ